MSDKLPSLQFIFTIFFLSACSGPYSMLDPTGPSAEISAWLWWGMFAWFMLVFIAVVALWIYAMRHDPGEISRHDSRKIQNRWVIGGGIILPVISITVILFFGVPGGHKILTLSADTEDLLRIDVTARQFEWIASYPERSISLQNEIHMPANTPVDIHLTTEDVIHSFWIPRLGRKLDTIPGRINILRLKADHPGIYHGQCAEYCGIEHAHMKFTVTVHSPEDFANWLEEWQTND